MFMSRLKMQRATSENSVELAALINSAYRGESSRKGWTTEADLLGGQRTDADALFEMLADPSQAFLIFKQTQKIIGCVLLKNESPWGYLGMLTVDPTQQSQGLGKSILAQAEFWAKEHWSTKSIWMTVITQRTELIDWYLRRGYLKTALRLPFPQHDPRFGIPKRQDLEFVRLEKKFSDQIYAPRA
jgi:ribosomal protein S18 acetylase RimI-like enzyme